ncbi:acetyl-CoA carboxylase / biotin carboxylase 1 [Nematocida sp. AWRm77]|nr:acetyl-CoA carboxylase / biotin carboxylase 1 [Nematocida sp. AWRm77]
MCINKTCAEIRMESADNVSAFVHGLGGQCRGTRVFVANNSLAALKFIMSLKDFSFRKFGECVFEFYGIERPSDRTGDSKYLDLLSDYKAVPADDPGASFKNVFAMCDAAEEFQCTYVWPGWGHASEDPSFPQECARRGLVFLGPSAEAMGKLGEKIFANHLADQCGVKTIPWMEVQGIEESKRFSAETGYPIMAKTPEGGGGKGIRVVEKEEDLEKQIETVKKETSSNKVFLTKYLKDIKHIELQVVADKKGEVCIVSSRDCTLQRRNQKLVEEGPAQIPESVIEEISEKAKKLVRAAEYTNAGTVEFVYDRETEEAYFLEANPRLQVEHTVTELLTDTNLCAVQWLLECGVSVAALQEHGLLQSMRTSRHVVAARVIAECADSGFVPCTGEVSVSASFPSGSTGYFAVDKGLIGAHNDSQFGHVFGTGSTREEAVRSLKMVLSSIKIHGSVKTLNRFLYDLVSTPEFSAGTHNTRFSEEYRKAWCTKHISDPFYFLAFVSILAHREEHSAPSGDTPMAVVLQYCGVEISAQVHRVDTHAFVVETNRGLSVIKLLPVAQDRYRVQTAEGKVKTLFLSQHGKMYDMFCNGKTRQFKLGSAGNEVVSEVAGRVVRFLKDGHVKKHEEYVEIESMKNIMQFSADREGLLVTKVSPGDIVSPGQVLAEISTSAPKESVKYTEKVEYRNTRENYTLNLFAGYSVPEKLLVYDRATVLEALTLYAGAEAFRDTKASCAYIARALQVLASTSDDFLPPTDLIRTIKYKACCAALPEMAKYAYALEQTGMQQSRVQEYKDVRQQLSTCGRDWFARKASASTSSEVVLLLCLAKEYAKDACLLWVQKTFGKEGCPKEGGVQFVVGEAVCFVTSEVLAGQAGIFSKEMLLFYIARKDAPPFSAPCMTTHVCVEDSLSVTWRTYQNEVLLDAYSEIDPILAKRLHIEPLQSQRLSAPSAPSILPKLTGVFWNRSIFVYATEECFRIQCILSPDNGTVTEKQLHALLREVHAAYVLEESTLPFAVSVCLTGPLAVSAEALSSLAVSVLSASIHHLEKCNVLEMVFRGTFSSSSRCTPEQTSCQAGTPSSEGASFLVSARTNRGFRETSLFVNQVQALYAIGSQVLQNTNGENMHTMHALQKEKRPEQITAFREKAKALDTIYIHDFALLIEAFLKEQAPDLTIESIQSGAPPCAMQGWKITSSSFGFVLVGNDITQNSGAFSIEEDKLFSACADVSLEEKLPFVYVSSNSGAKIQVLEHLKERILYDAPTDTVYLTQEAYGSLPDKAELRVSELLLNNVQVYKIEAIFGQYGMGVENLSYSAEIAHRMALLYQLVPTLTYATGRAVGIGAYLARLGSRVIQKATAPIILTGFQALNRLLQRKMYSSNLEIGGPNIMAKNGIVQKVVSTDLEGAREILKWLDYITPSRSDTSGSIGGSESAGAGAGTESAQTSQLELLNAEEIVEYLSDRDMLTEYFEEWAPNVRIARTKIEGVPCGVIYPRVGSITTEKPSTSGSTKVLWTEYVLLPETSRKIAQAIRDFSLEGLNIVLLANWKGFSAGHINMYTGILQDGSEIVNSMVFSNTKVFVYIGPNAELRGGSWVVFDKKIGSNVFFAAHPTATGSVIHPDGLSRIKCKPAELESILARSEAENTKTNQFSLGKKFCTLHDTSERMLKMEVIDKTISVASLKKEILLHFRN